MRDDDEQLPDRLVFLTHAEYVHLKDDHPQLLRDNRVAVIPYPLVGRWMQHTALKSLQVGPGDVVLRDPRSGQGYLPAESALRALSIAQAHAFSRVCQLLGATRLKVVEYDTNEHKTKVDNRLTAGASASFGTTVRSTRDVSADLGADMSQEVRRFIEATGSWQGGTPDITGARVVASQFQDVSGAVSALIEMRATETNQLRSYSVHVDFLSEVHRQVDLIIDLAAGLEVALGESASAGLRAKLRNKFSWSTDRRRHEAFSVEVSFTDSQEAS